MKKKEQESQAASHGMTAAGAENKQSASCSITESNRKVMLVISICLLFSKTLKKDMFRCRCHSDLSWFTEACQTHLRNRLLNF